MLILIILLPLFGFLTAILLGRYLGVGISFLTTFFVLLSFLLSLFLFYSNVLFGSSAKILLGSWIFVDTLNIKWSFCFDSLTCVMLIVVTFISTLVHLYSTEYMENDPHVIRFMSYLLCLFGYLISILLLYYNLSSDLHGTPHNYFNILTL